jgi:hypothetical protein
VEALSFIDRCKTRGGKRGDIVMHFDKLHRDQSLQITRAEGRQLGSVGFDVSQCPSKPDRGIEI